MSESLRNAAYARQRRPLQDEHLAELHPLEEELAGLPATLDANSENFFVRLPEPHLGHFAPCQSVDRTSSSHS
ncbi:MAG: hypothetical protein RMH97_01610 [Verrucomicrobiales bacterium]|nr:hypothetical protein [Verrucomicrobiales bacterium]